MPAVAAAFFHAAQTGETRSLQEVATANHSVRGEVARTASHPSIVMWARLVTTVFSLLLILLTYLIARPVGRGRLMSARVAGDPNWVVTDGGVRTRLAPFDAVSLGITPSNGGNQLLTPHPQTPWPSQCCRLELPERQSPDPCVGIEPNHWPRGSIDIPAGALAETDCPVDLRHARAPRARGAPRLQRSAHRS